MPTPRTLQEIDELDYIVHQFRFEIERLDTITTDLTQQVRKNTADPTKALKALDTLDFAIYDVRKAITEALGLDRNFTFEEIAA